MTEKKRLVIIDANSIIHRAYHALPPLTTKEGELVNAVYGFLLVLFKVLRELRPDYAAAAFDFPGLTFRHEMFEEYKAKRPKAPEELYNQIPRIKEILGVFNIPVLEKQGFEADDIISAVNYLSQSTLPIETVVVSGDSDILQLIDEQTKVFLLRKGVKDIVLCDKNFVQEKYQGLSSGQLADFRGLRGDPSDNIPGVKGIGEKTAIELLNQFGDLDNLYQEIEKNSEKSGRIKPAVLKKLQESKERAFLSRELAQLKKDAPIDFKLEDCAFFRYEKEKAASLLASLGFKTLLDRLP